MLGFNCRECHESCGRISPLLKYLLPLGLIILKSSRLSTSSFHFFLHILNTVYWDFSRGTCYILGNANLQSYGKLCIFSSFSLLFQIKERTRETSLHRTLLYYSNIERIDHFFSFHGLGSPPTYIVLFFIKFANEQMSGYLLQKASHRSLRYVWEHLTSVSTIRGGEHNPSLML